MDASMTRYQRARGIAPAETTEILRSSATGVRDYILLASRAPRRLLALFLTGGTNDIRRTETPVGGQEAAPRISGSPSAS